MSVDFEIKDNYNIDDLVKIVTVLRAPGGCPWDREQTHESIKKNFIASAYERNIRLLIHRSEEFVEEKHCNLLVHNVGVESFKGSNIMCMFSQRALNHFGWEIVFDDGLKIVDSNNKMIGRFEYYYGLRTEMGNSVYMNQPVIQRWVVTNEAFTEIQNMLVYDLKQVADAKVFEF